CSSDLVVQLADPVIGRGGGGQAGVTGMVEDAALLRQAHHVVVHHAAVDRGYAGHGAFVERPGQCRQLAFEFVQGGAAGSAVGVQMAQGVAGDLVVEAIQQHQDDFVRHRKFLGRSGARGAPLRGHCISMITFSCHSCGRALDVASQAAASLIGWTLAYCSLGSSLACTSGGRVRCSARIGRALPLARLIWPTSERMYSRASLAAFGCLAYLLMMVV